MNTEELIPIHEPLFHYTTQKGLFGITCDKVMWATDILYLNDSTEFRYTLDLIQEEIAELKKSTPNDDIFYLERIDDMADSRLRVFDSPFFRTFVCSFSRKPDELSQWRGYGNREGGFSIGVNFSKIANLISQQGFKLMQCNYERDQQKQIIRNKLKILLGQLKEQTNYSPLDFGNPSKSRLFSETFLPLASIFKHPKFHEEDEWRVISPETIYNDEKICYREGKSMIIPYMLFKLADSENPLPISKVIIGPTPFRELSKSSIKSFLQSRGIRCDVINSEVPYRNV
jgi:hypothetical protein